MKRNFIPSGPFMKPNSSFLLMLVLSLLITSCKKCKDDPIKPKVEEPPTSAAITFKFSGLYNNVPADYTKFYLTLAGDTVRFDLVKYIFSDFVLEKTSGELVKIPNAYGFISLSIGIDSFVIKNVPFGEYKSIRIMVGLDSATNHGDPIQWGKIDLNHPLNPIVNNMHWGWSGGYIFNVTEGYYKNKGVNEAFSFHVALDKNIRNNIFAYNYSVTKNCRFSMNVNIDKFLSNAVNFSLKTDGSFSHSGDTDPVMDKFLMNSNGIIAIKDFK